jgi:DNA-binding response OmpR family regulator
MTSAKRILIVEDDKNISHLIQYNLEKEGYICVIASKGEDALTTLNKKDIDLIILDIMLPGIDGFDVCRKIKQTDKIKNIPVIMLTAKGEEIDRVVGLELGADDYIVKPFSPRELILRVKAILRRGNSSEQKKDTLTIENITIDTAKHKVTIAEKSKNKNKDAKEVEIELTPMEFKLLLTLSERRGRVQSREKLLSDVWNTDVDIDTRTVDTHIKRLREKLRITGDLIETVHGIGYRLKE